MIPKGWRIIPAQIVRKTFIEVGVGLDRNTVGICDLIMGLETNHELGENDRNVRKGHRLLHIRWQIADETAVSRHE